MSNQTIHQNLNSYRLKFQIYNLDHLRTKSPNTALLGRCFILLREGVDSGGGGLVETTAPRWLYYSVKVLFHYTV